MRRSLTIARQAAHPHGLLGHLVARVSALARRVAQRHLRAPIRARQVRIEDGKGGRIWQPEAPSTRS